jgi:outer membrane lipoprotein-sorting protein
MKRLALVLLLGVSGAASATDAPWGLGPLMAQLHAVKQTSAHFTERKTAAMLTQPIESTGTLSYTAPGSLKKTTLTPKPESIALDDDQLTGIQANGDRFDVRLSDHPEIGALVEGMRATLAGDPVTLGRYYSIALEGTRDDWHLTLTPLDRAVRAKVDAIRIDGAEAQLRRIQVHEPDGDRSDMIVTPDQP